MLGLGDGDLLFEHFVEFGGADELIRNDNLSILFLGLSRFKYVVGLGVLFAEDAVGGLLADDGLTIFEDGVFGSTLKD